MEEENKKEVENEELEDQEELKFGYVPSVIFLVFIGFVIYFSLSR